MKILAVSDMIVERLYTPLIAERFREVELILACGDLPYHYLEFLVTAMNIPLLYVPGNHDPAYNTIREDTEALGCELMDRRVKKIKGLIIAGMGGSIHYSPGGPNQYTQSQMYGRMFALFPRLLFHLPWNANRLDIFIAHSPPRGIHDDKDQAHIGFKAFMDFIHTFKPRYFLHGHTVMYKNNLVEPVTKVGETTVINVYPYRMIEI